MNWLTLVGTVFSFLINLFVKDKNKKEKMVRFIEERTNVPLSTVGLREDYERQKKELERAEDSDTTLH